IVVRKRRSEQFGFCISTSRICKNDVIVCINNKNVSRSCSRSILRLLRSMEYSVRITVARRYHSFPQTHNISDITNLHANDCFENH
ncbi:hypothetical protein GJ496_004743, partial [Pomphorhynchus laevis]